MQRDFEIGSRCGQFPFPFVDGARLTQCFLVDRAAERIRGIQDVQRPIQSVFGGQIRILVSAERPLLGEFAPHPRVGVLFQFRKFRVAVEEFAGEPEATLASQGFDQLAQIVQRNQFTREDVLTTRHGCVRSG